MEEEANDLIVSSEPEDSKDDVVSCKGNSLSSCDSLMGESREAIDSFEDVAAERQLEMLMNSTDIYPMVDNVLAHEVSDSPNTESRFITSSISLPRPVMMDRSEGLCAKGEKSLSVDKSNGHEMVLGANSDDSCTIDKAVSGGSNCDDWDLVSIIIPPEELFHNSNYGRWALSMEPKKGSEKEGKGKNLRWSKPMNSLLLEILADEATKGNKPSNTFRPVPFARFAKEITRKYEVECQSKHVENRLKTIESTWKIISDLRYMKSGFGWDGNMWRESV
ncbi:hypothetical protein Vadar_026877 [Vaccinium darrowii]|uniref:Uncharacterized protein n=1 Tax=Vaccinium darrowii TaxID=229202 RepID=A0ACB7ZEK2_9ERIC|nr:hypothetical protein Vadar_026877 [Vaccinium darrowii]